MHSWVTNNKVMLFRRLDYCLDDLVPILNTDQHFFGGGDICASAAHFILIWLRVLWLFLVSFENMKNIKINTTQFHTLSKREILINGKLFGISALKAKKINFSLIVHFCLGKYNFSLDTFFLTQLVFGCFFKKRFFKCKSKRIIVQ